MPRDAELHRLLSMSVESGEVKVLVVVVNGTATKKTWSFGKGEGGGGEI